MKIALVLGLPNSTVAAVCPRCTAPWPSAVRITGLPHGRLSHHVGEKADGDFFSTTGKRSSENKEAGKVRDHLQRQLGAPVQQWRPSGLRSSECHLWPGPLSLWGVQWRQKQHQRRYGPIGPRLSFSWCCWTIRSRPSGVDPTQLRWSIRGDPLLNIQWRKGFVSLLGGTAGTLAQQPGQFIKAPGHEGLYECAASNTCGGDADAVQDVSQPPLNVHLAAIDSMLFQLEGKCLASDRGNPVQEYIQQQMLAFFLSINLQKFSNSYSLQVLCPSVRCWISSLRIKL